MRFELFVAALYPAMAIASFDCYAGQQAGRDCCMKNHSVCNHQRGCLGSCTVCYEKPSVYCGNCPTDCCTFRGGELHDDGDGSTYTSAPELWGTYCKS